MLIYVNFHKIKHVYIYKKKLQVIEMLNIVFAKFTWAVFRSPAYLTFKNLK